MARFIDMTGAKSGRLTALRADHQGRKGSWYWLCLCDCGKEVIVSGSHLRTGHTKSCGCLNDEVRTKRIKKLSTTHGGSKTEQLYGVWVGMRKRCNNSKYYAFQWYGARGIGVCPEWDNSYAAFRTWSLSNGYRSGLSIDRIDNNGNYSPENCRWSTRKEQQNNTRSNIYIYYLGSMYTVATLAEKLGVNRALVYDRLRDGWTEDAAFLTPRRHKARAAQ